MSKKMALHSFTNMAIQQARFNATDFFVIATGATTFALGFFGLNEGPERLWIAGAFALLALAFFASSFICWVQYRLYVRQAIETRVYSVAATAGAAPAERKHQGAGLSADVIFMNAKPKAVH